MADAAAAGTALGPHTNKKRVDTGQKLSALKYTGETPPVKESEVSGTLVCRCFCPSCGTANSLAPPGDPAALPPCRSCGKTLPFQSPGAVAPGGAVTICPFCGDDKLYLVKDFDQRIGCLIVAVGAALVPWTYGLSLAVCALIDWLAYRLLPLVTVCYICATKYRGAPLNPDHKPFDLLTAQTWEARTLNWRKLHDQSAD
ncbi:MAG TPA: hypothetical protein VFE84_12415 [Patescibacteria group bacterium]|nr:hypothetical protein [Patescibacteria group bacterium]